jgi:hypothetical protein
VAAWNKVMNLDRYDLQNRQNDPKHMSEQEKKHEERPAR